MTPAAPRRAAGVVLCSLAAFASGTKRETPCGRVAAQPTAATSKNRSLGRSASPGSVRSRHQGSALGRTAAWAHSGNGRQGAAIPLLVTAHRRACPVKSPSRNDSPPTRFDTLTASPGAKTSGWPAPQLCCRQMSSTHLHQQHAHIMLRQLRSKFPVRPQPLGALYSVAQQPTLSGRFRARTAPRCRAPPLRPFGAIDGRALRRCRRLSAMRALFGHADQAARSAASMQSGPISMKFHQMSGAGSSRGCLSKQEFPALLRYRRRLVYFICDLIGAFDRTPLRQFDKPAP